MKTQLPYLILRWDAIARGYVAFCRVSNRHAAETLVAWLGNNGDDAAWIGW